ncbi:MAG: hybrid sensor histidine kinase/response regulator [Planctomycetota bacterium]|jgi:PAS domain S-box-containing protein
MARPVGEGAAGLLDRIVDAIADPLFVKDEQHRWIVVNQAFCEFMGHPREALIGKSDFEFFPEEEAETFWAKDAEVFETGEVNINEEPLTDADGNRHIIVTKKSVFTRADGSKILVGIIRDVTELKRAEDALRRSRDELERRVEERTREVEEAQSRLWQAEKMEAIGQLTGGVAHDFNNLLGVILGSAELLGSGELNEEEAAAYTATIMGAGRRAADLVQQLLAFSRPTPSERSTLDLHAMIEEVVRILSQTIDPRIAVNARLGASRATVSGDRSALQAALLNLGLNARDAMPEGGELTFSTAEVTSGDAGAYLEIVVADTGAGIPSELLCRVFEPFFTTKPVGKGSGLGLAAVYGTIQAHNGSITAGNNRTSGAHFRILLPISSEEPEEVEVRDGVVRGTGRILVVDDEFEIRRLADDMLTSAGYEVVLADGGEQALALYDGDFDLVVLDYVMPELNGSQVLRALRRFDPSVRVLIVSGFQLDRSQQDVRNEGAIDLLRKPFLAADLTRAVAAALTADPAPRR